jgi:predicted metalloprotease with PDZ domain
VLRVALVILAACSDSSSKPTPAPAPKPSPDAAIASTVSPGPDDLNTASWIGVRLNEHTIYEVIEGTPAKRAGVEPGDRLVSLYGEPIYALLCTR